MITLKTLPTATRQEIFNQIAKHMLTQKKKSIFLGGDGRNTCAYRGEEGTKCAAGCLISDTEYDPDMEGRSWHHLVDDELVPKTHQLLIRDLQYLHDQESVEDWRENLRIIAKAYYLECNF